MIQGVIQKVRSLGKGVGEGVIEKRTKTNSGREGPSMSVGSLFLKKC